MKLTQHFKLTILPHTPSKIFCFRHYFKYKNQIRKDIFINQNHE